MWVLFFNRKLKGELIKVSDSHKPQTKEQILATENREKLYEYYGIPYGVFDNLSKNIENTNIEKDRITVQILIMRGEKIPEDLEQRLLTYKKQDNGKQDD